MPYADPEKQREYNRRKYKERSHLWKNSDGSWKKSNYDRKESCRKHYEKNKIKIRLKAKIRIQKAREKRTNNCPLCGAYEVLVYDHDHKTNIFRGYICQSCNLALGHARDEPTVLRKMAEYLECQKN